VIDTCYFNIGLLNTEREVSTALTTKNTNIFTFENCINNNRY